MPEKIISYQNVQSPLGEMIAGATNAGIAFLEWHDRGGVDRILERVAKRYDCSFVQQPSDLVARLALEVEEYFGGTRTEFTVPLDVDGTPFELRVWKSLLDIRYGTTRSYGELAASLGRAGASRAVGRANGANYVSIIIPCHRVIESTGALCGYGGGVWRKKHLLEHERSIGRRSNSSQLQLLAS